MSWGFKIVGKPEQVAAELESLGEGKQKTSKSFRDAMPHLVALLKENFSVMPGQPEVFVSLDISHSGYTVDDRVLEGTLNVELKRIYGKVV